VSSSVYVDYRASCPFIHVRQSRAGGKSTTIEMHHSALPIPASLVGCCAKLFIQEHCCCRNCFLSNTAYSEKHNVQKTAPLLTHPTLTSISTSIIMPGAYSWLCFACEKTKLVWIFWPLWEHDWALRKPIHAIRAQIWVRFLLLGKGQTPLWFIGTDELFATQLPASRQWSSSCLNGDTCSSITAVPASGASAGFYQLWGFPTLG
jgi:hypothetical protein